MPHVTWDPDLPPLLVEAHMDEIQTWVRGVFAREFAREYRLIPDELALSRAPDNRIVVLRLVRQRNRETGEERITVQPRSRDDAQRMEAWARRHEGFDPADFQRARKVAQST